MGNRDFSNMLSNMDKLTTPLHVEGYCAEQTLPEITSIDDLRKYSDLLECYFATGTKELYDVPTGNMPGELIQNPLVLNFTNNAVNVAYQGEFVFPYNCAAGAGFIGTTDIFGLTAAVGEYYTSIYESESEDFPNLRDGQGEFGDEINYLMMDFTINPNDLCPITPNHRDSLIPLKSGAAPGSAYFDVATIVGFTVDDEPILLSKAFAQSLGGHYNSQSALMERTWANVIFYAFIVKNPASMVGEQDSYKDFFALDYKVAQAFEYRYLPVIDIHVAALSAFPHTINNRVQNFAAMVPNVLEAKDNLKKFDILKLKDKVLRN